VFLLVEFEINFEMKNHAISVVRVIQNNTATDIIKKTTFLLLVTLVFLFALDLATESLKSIVGLDYLRKSFNEVYSPFVALFVGLLATALVQSSTLITSLSVALVASGTLSVQNAVPIVMGANIGTTITCMLVSFGHVMRRKEFRKAVAGSMLHVAFNIVPTILIFPLEYYWGFLSGISMFLASGFSGEQSALNFKGFYFSEYITVPIIEALHIENYATIWLGLAVLSAFLCIRLFIVMFRKVLVNDFTKRVESLFWAKPWRGFVWGVLITALVHSSTVVTSFLVTLVGSNRLSLRQAFPLIMGANLGTTLTALTASLGKSEAAMSIAFAHCLFNLFSVLLVLPFPWVQTRIIFLCRRFGRLTMQHRLAGFLYVLIVFFLIPFLLIYLNKQ
jgi:sodium-dependent phosphate cotransporter